MKGAIKTVCMALALITLFSAALIAGTKALAVAPTAPKSYSPDRPADAVSGKTDSGPQKQADMQSRFSVYDHTSIDENGEDVLTFFSEEQAEELRSRRENGELFTLSYDEVLYIINDSIVQYNSHDCIVLTNATKYSLIPACKRQRSLSHHIHCFNEGFDDMSFNEAMSTYDEVLDDIFCIIVYRLSMLDSSFAYCEQYTAADLSRWLLLDGQLPAFQIREKTEHFNPSRSDLAVWVKSFAQADTLEKMREKTAGEFGVYYRKEDSRISPYRSDIYEEWMNAKLEAPLLVADFNSRYNSIQLCETDGLTLTSLYPTAELKNAAPLYDPAKETEIEIQKKFGRQTSELMAKDLMPDYDLNKPTPAYPLKYYREGIGDKSPLKEGMSFAEAVELFGLPYNGQTSGMFTLNYYTEEKKTIVLYLTPIRYSQEEGKVIGDYYITDILWPKE
ncbi:MAG: hypothetical protein IJV00_02160 [Clostridia bacterium]|nr:hypothetical protein [Clostridia bacterium]